MAYQDLEAAKAAINERFADNPNREITPARLREVATDIVDFFGEKVPFYNRIRHSGDASTAVSASDFIVICDQVSAIRTVTLPTTPVNGQRVLLFVKEGPTDEKWWQTNVPFYTGTEMRQRLMAGRQELVYDEVDSRWILIGGY